MLPSGTLDLSITTSLGTVFLFIPEYNSAALPAWVGVVVVRGVLMDDDLFRSGL